MNMSRRFFTLATLLAAAVFGAPSGHTQTVPPIPAPTIITTAPYTITTSGYYQLGADLYYGGNGVANDAIITINASNVTLDFGGHFISGPSDAPGTTLYGVYALEKGNLTILNGTIAFCSIGILTDGLGNSGSLNINQRVQNMLISYCYSTGIEFSNTFNSVAANNRVSFIGGGSTSAFAIYDVGGQGDEATGNIITNVMANNSNIIAYGIYGVQNASNNIVSRVSNSSGAAQSAIGIGYTQFAVNNTISFCYYGILSPPINGGKYKDNLTLGCTTPFSGGTAVGTNN